MNITGFKIFTAVLIYGTAAVLFIFSYPKDEVVNTQAYTVDTQSIVEKEIVVNPLSELLKPNDNETYVLPFSLLNRELPARWYNKDITIKYTYLGEYTDSTVSELNTLLNTEYSWKKQLDKDRKIVLGGPIFLMDNVYQLHTHNGLSLANRQYLFGDLLHYLHSRKELEGTRIQIGEVTLEAVWTKDTRVLQDSTTPGGSDLVISTCLERDGDRRLISGWVVAND
jgi:hypothetical protein